MAEGSEKCSTCIGKYEYKTSSSCRYCKWNIESYFGRNDLKMIEDNYKYVNTKVDDNIPY